MFKKNYLVLRIVAIVLRIGGWLSPVLGTLIGILLFMGVTKPNIPKISGITAIVLGIIYFLLLHGIADVIKAFLSIEENSKKIASLLEENKGNS